MESESMLAFCSETERKAVSPCRENTRPRHKCRYTDSERNNRILVDVLIVQCWWEGLDLDEVSACETTKILDDCECGSC